MLCTLPAEAKRIDFKAVHGVAGNTLKHSGVAAAVASDSARDSTLKRSEGVGAVDIEGLA